MSIFDKDNIDMRDITDRAKEIETEAADILEIEECELDEETADKLQAAGHEDLANELRAIVDLLDETRGNGGDHQWRGDWYPAQLINGEYFTEAMEELCKDCGIIPSNIPDWIEIDWEATAENMKVDYGSVEFLGENYYYR